MVTFFTLAVPVKASLVTISDSVDEDGDEDDNEDSDNDGDCDIPNFDSPSDVSCRRSLHTFPSPSFTARSDKMAHLYILS